MGVAESSYEYQFCIYPKVSLSLGFKNCRENNSYPKSATPEFEESGRDILITEHSYAPEYDQTLLAGRFCVQFLTAKNNKIGLNIISWWQKKCVNWCCGKLEDGKFGDQKYLDSWPVLFSDTIWILQQKENTLAP